MIERTITDAPRNCFGARLLLLAWLADLCSQLFEVSPSLTESVLAFELGAQSDLQQLRRWEIALLGP